MDKTRTLPPLVRGRVTKVLEFFVDKIKFFRNILLLTDNFDLVLQVQWWGESLPAHIRPKELQIQDRILKNSQSLQAFHKEKYEIKTTSELFQSYLKTCEILELSVLETVENYIIGSAFVRNLINLLKNNNELISMPIFDYLGEEIGEVVIHVNFFEKPFQKLELKLNENAQLPNERYIITKSKEDFDELRDSGDYLSLEEKTLSYGSLSTQRNHQKEYLHKELQPQVNQFDVLKSNSRKINLPSTIDISKPLLNQEESVMVGNAPSSESLPNIKILSDSSKVLYFGLSSQLSRPKTDIKNNKIKVNNKYSSKSIKYKSKLISLSDQNVKERKRVTKTATSSCDFPEKPTNVKKEKELDLKVSDKLKKSEVFPGNKQMYDQSYSLRENSHAKVLDYLFGCDMSKVNEESALNDFKKMSPSHTLVDSISQLYLASDNNVYTSGNKVHSESSISAKHTSLNFDFNNPIERNYYEKFFLNSSSDVNFEVAEFLNHPENSFKLGKSIPYEAEPQKKSQVSSLKSCSKVSLSEDKTKNSVSGDYLVNDFRMSDRAKSCGRCKYYKKLSELDTIIESLKHFEQKMIMYEKNSQNSEELFKKKIAEES